MSWTGSAMFTQWVYNPLLTGSGTAPTGYTHIGSGGNTVKAALYDDDITPDKNAAVGLTGYDAATSQWVSSGNEVTDSDGSSDWSAGGIALSNQALTSGSGYVMFDADDTSHSNTVTLTSAYGCLVYNDSITAGTVADQGISYHYFGGAQSVTVGSFTIVWHANGVFRITV